MKLPKGRGFVSSFLHAIFNGACLHDHFSPTKLLICSVFIFLDIGTGDEITLVLCLFSFMLLMKGRHQCYTTVSRLTPQQNFPGFKMCKLVATLEGCYSTAMLERLKLVGYNLKPAAGTLHIRPGQTICFLFVDFVFAISLGSARGSCHYHIGAPHFFSLILFC